MSDNPSNFIGFPAPLLGDQSLRLPVVYDDGILLAISKPTDVGVLQDNWYPRTPILVEAIRHQAAQEKGELLRLGVSKDGLYALHDLDVEVAGIVLFSREQSHAEEFKNEVGSRSLQFEFLFLCAQSPNVGSVFCDLPLARHFKDKRMMVSHQTGKKSETKFELLEPYGRFSLWRATTSYFRRHQVMIHAQESGLSILGNRQYGSRDPLMLSEIKKGYRPHKDREEQALYPGVSLILNAIKLPDGRVIQADYPPKFATQLKYVRKFSI